MFDLDDNQRDRPWTISQVTERIKTTLETQFSRFWLVGEISNFKAAASGHWYFSLKDDKSQIRINMWRSSAARAPFRPKDGMEVLVRGTLNVYAPRGEYSLVADQIQEMGVGRLKQEFERLKIRLRDEGLFDPEHKQSLPLLPRKIGIVTSPTGAALRDMLRVLNHRFEGIHVLLAPARVQGSGAAEEIAVGIQYLDRFGDCDVIIIGRGGGSEEDLWAFNEETVARAVFASQTPIISAVGHEVDFTIADFVADVRAATPSNAAELAVHTKDAYQKMIRLAEQQLAHNLQRKLIRWRQQVQVSQSHPIFVKMRSRVNDVQRKLAELDFRQQNRMNQKVQGMSLRLASADASLKPQKLIQASRHLASRLEYAQKQLDERMMARLEAARGHAGGLIMRLADLSPLRILGRGYAVIYDGKDKVVRDPQKVATGTVLRLQMAEGHLFARAIEAPHAIEQPDLFD